MHIRTSSVVLIIIGELKRAQGKMLFCFTFKYWTYMLPICQDWGLFSTPRNVEDFFCVGPEKWQTAVF